MPEVIFNGTEGRLEGRYHHSKTPGAPIALMLHPHPQHGGTMNNKVVYAMYQSYVQRGYSVLRFNFRGVGRSQGTFDNGLGELSDAASALDWMQTYNPNAAGVWIAGFSFGAWIAMQLLMRRPEVVGFIAAAPPANQYDFSFLAPCPSSGLILQGDKDEIVPPEDSKKLADKLTSQKNITVDYELIKDADHFYTNKLDKFTGLINAYMDKRTKAEAA